MKRNRSVTLLALLSLVTVLALATGCYRQVVPDVVEPTATEESAPASEGQVATAIAEATQSAGEEGEGEAEQPTEAAPEGEAGAEGEPVATSTPSPESEPTEPPATELPAPTSAPTEPPATAAPAESESGQPAGTVTHVVQAGENLFRIALRYNTTVQAISEANGIANPQQIYVGQQLTIPSAGSAPAPQPSGDGATYVVQPGDNLFRIALKYNLSYLYLAQYNGISNVGQVYVGQVLRIPPQ